MARWIASGLSSAPEPTGVRSLNARVLCGSDADPAAAVAVSAPAAVTAASSAASLGEGGVSVPARGSDVVGDPVVGAVGTGRSVARGVVACGAAEPGLAAVDDDACEDECVI
jgi:hypothetical protein